MTTPKGTRTFSIFRPSGVRQPETTSPTGSGNASDVAQTAGDAAQALLVKPEPVDERSRESLFASFFDVFAVLDEDLARAPLKGLGHGHQGLVLVGGVRRSQTARGNLGACS